MDSTQEGNSGNLQTITHVNICYFTNNLPQFISCTCRITMHVNIHRCVYVIIIEPMYLPML